MNCSFMKSDLTSPWLPGGGTGTRRPSAARAPRPENAGRRARARGPDGPATGIPKGVEA